MGASSAGLAPCMITASAPRASWPCTAAAHCVGGARCARRQPLVGDQGGDVFELLGRGDRVDGAGELRHHLVGAESGEHGRIPTVRLDHQVAVALQVGGEPSDRLLQPEVLGDVVADRGETRPDGDVVGIAAGPLGGVLHGADAALQRLVGEERVEDHVIERPPAEFERVRTERDEPERDVLVELRIEPQHRIRAERPGVARPRSRRARAAASTR